MMEVYADEILKSENCNYTRIFGATSYYDITDLNRRQRPFPMMSNEAG
jgi:hypothetical protein